MKQFLVDLFARPQTDEFDPDILVRAQAGETDHLSGKMGDTDRLSHVEDEYLALSDAALDSEGRGLEHEFDSLPGRHEVARRVFVGDGEGASCSELALEQWDHRSCRTEHISESNGDESGSRTRLSLGEV